MLLPWNYVPWTHVNFLLPLTLIVSPASYFSCLFSLPVVPVEGTEGRGWWWGEVFHLGESKQSIAAAAAAAAASLQSCPTLCDPIDGQPTRLPRPWASPGKNTGVGCHFLLPCRKVKSESEVAQSCPTLCDVMDCSLPGSSVHGIFQARVLEWGAIAFSEQSIKLHITFSFI